LSEYNILIAGVGGQGNLLLGRVLADAAADDGYRPVIGETFGASRRGGTVYTHLRIAKSDLGPLIPRGRLDLLVGLEPLEALRASVKFAGLNTTAIVAIEPVQSTISQSGEVDYPDVKTIIDHLRKLCGRVEPINTKEILQTIGTYRVLNTLILGIISEMEITPLRRETIQSSLDKTIGFRGLNKEAFLAGVEVVVKSNKI